jgi:CTP synthase
MTRYIVVTGGVMSGLGKGITAASIGRMMKARGYSVTAVKADGYFNIDAGTLRPTEHGEVWVTSDGGEIDEDLGHYERFLDQDIPKSHNITSGQIYGQVIQNERQGKYLGKTVQFIPHITDEVKRRIREIAVSEKIDILILEVGGVVGDYENLHYTEAIRQMRMEEGSKSLVHIHVSYVPIPSHLGEPKTKPTQHSVKKLREEGLPPDFIVCRSSRMLDEVRKNKISLFCDVYPQDIISNPDIECIYELPLLFEEQGFGERIQERFGMRFCKPKLSEWASVVERMKNPKDCVDIAIVGKYVDIGEYRLPDCYISINEAIIHAAAKYGWGANINWVDSKEFEEDEDSLSILDDHHGLIVPGGFGKTGVEGKISAVAHARRNDIPFLGICFGFQFAVVEFSRNELGLEGAHTTEFDPDTPYPVIDILPEQKEVIRQSKYGASMRLGAYPAKLDPKSKIGVLYRSLGRYEEDDIVSERHRHRYEVNPEYVERIDDAGLRFVGRSPDGILMEFYELEGHPYFVGTQGHPEFLSRPLRPAPLFCGLIASAIDRKRNMQG